MYFKRLNNKYIRLLTDLIVKPQPFQTSTITSFRLSKKEQIDLLAVKAYGEGNEGMFSKIAYKNADQLLAWDLDNKYINIINVPNSSDY